MVTMENKHKKHFISPEYLECCFINNIKNMMISHNEYTVPKEHNKQAISPNSEYVIPQHNKRSISPNSELHVEHTYKKKKKISDKMENITTNNEDPPILDNLDKSKEFTWDV